MTCSMGSEAASTQLRIDVSHGTVKPSKQRARGEANLNFARILRDALYTGTNAKLTLPGATTGGTGPLATIRANEYFHSDFNLEIPYDLLRSIEEDILYLLKFIPVSDNPVENHHHRSEYLLDYLTHLNEALKGRFKDAYKFLDQLFQDHQSVGALTISFIVETGAGINCQNGPLYKKFSDYGIKNFQIQFDPSKSEDRHRAIQSILFYTSLDPRIMAVLQEGRLEGMGKTVRGEPIFLGFARGKIYDASYIRTSSQAKAFDGPSWWGEDSAEFQRILKEFNGDPQDSEHYPGIFKVSDFVDITVFTNKGIDLERAIFVFEHLALFFFKFTKTEYKQYKFESNLIEDLTDERHFTLKTMTE